MKKIIKIVFLLTVCLINISISIAYTQEQKKSLEENIDYYRNALKQDSSKRKIEIIDVFFEKNKDNKQILYSLKNRITKLKVKKASLLSNKSELLNLLKYLEVKNDLAILELSQEQDENQKILIVNYDFLNVRQWPSTNYKKLLQVHRWDKLILLEDKEGWCNVITPDWTRWWVSKDYVIEENISDNITNDDEFWGNVVEIAKKYLWYSYKLWEESPERWFDCSGFVYYVFKKAGKDLGRMNSIEMSKLWYFVDKENLEIWDLLFFKYYWSENIAHVWIYMWDNIMIHSTPWKWVTTVDLDSSYYVDNYVMAKRVK